MFVIVEYLLLASVVIFAAVKASNLIDMLDKKTNIGGALIGGVLLAAITSLPELITSLSSVAILDNANPDMAFGNIFGSNVFNLVIIGVADIIFLKHMFLDKVSDVNNKNNVFVIMIYVVMIASFGLGANKSISFAFFSFNLVSLIILVLYSLSIRMLAGATEDQEDNEHKEDVKSSLTQIVLSFVFWAAVLVLASIKVTVVADEIANVYHLDSSFAGALFLGIATSLPEATSVFNLVRLRNYDVAISNIIGSNVFNFAIISFVDVLYTKGDIFRIANTGSNLPLLYIGIANSMILLYALVRKSYSSKFTYLIPSILIVVNYLIYLALSV